MSPRARSVRPGNYAEQARTYDYTRGASPTVVRTVAKYLGHPGGLLLDIAGGTGTYAQIFEARGFRVVVVDASFDMLLHAARKLGRGRAVAGDAERLPIRDGAADRAIIVSALHLMEKPSAVLGEARRVLGCGPFVLQAFTSENLRPLFVHEYFGLPPVTSRRSADEYVALLADAGFVRIVHEPFVYTDSVDGSLAALHTDPMHLAGRAYLRNTSFWHRLDEETRRKGLEALARDLRSGLLEERVRESFKLAMEHGHGTVFAAWP